MDLIRDYHHRLRILDCENWSSNGDLTGREHPIPMDCYHQPVLIVAFGPIPALALFDPRILSGGIL